MNIQNDSQNEYWVPKEPPKAKYKIEAIFDHENKIIEGNQTITFKNHSIRGINIISFNLSIFEFLFLEIKVNKTKLKVINDKKKDFSPVFFKLEKPLMPNNKIQLGIKFKKFFFINKKEEIKLQKWYPLLWWDGLKVASEYKIKIYHSPQYKIFTSGILNEKTGYYENNHASIFGIYLKKKAEILTNKCDDIYVSILYTKKCLEWAQFCLNSSIRILKFFKFWLGFYPFNYLHIIPGDDHPVGGYTFSPGIIAIHGSEKFHAKSSKYWEKINARQISNQYWGEYVFGKDNPEWLLHGLSIFTEYSYMMFQFPEDKLKYYPDLIAYQFGVKFMLDTTIDIPPPYLKNIKYDYNYYVTNGKSFSVIIGLESLLDKDIFKNIYLHCLKKYGGKRLGYKEFWQICENISGQNLDWYFEEWVRSDRYICYRVSSKKHIKNHNGFIYNISIENLGTMKMTVSIKAIFEDESYQIQNTNRCLKNNILQFKSKTKVKEIIIDPEHKVGLLKEPLSPVPEGLSKNDFQSIYFDSFEGLLDLFKKAIKLNFRNDEWWYQFGYQLARNGYLNESFKIFKKIIDSNPSEIYLTPSLVWLGHLEDLRNKRNSALKYYRLALNTYSGKPMGHSRYGIVINDKWIMKMIKEPFRWKKYNLI